MKPKKLHRELSLLGIACLGFWIVTTFAPICLWLIKGGIPAPNGASVPRQSYLALLDLTQGILYHVIPALTAGYLLFGLFVLKCAHKARIQDESKPRV